jgi:hypothetical protein
MHGVPIKLLLEAILAVLRRPAAGPRERQLVPTRLRSAPERRAIPTVSLLLREANGQPKRAATKRRSDFVDWSETQPWCHQ